jgi:serine/threonine protein kinase
MDQYIKVYISYHKDSGKEEQPSKKYFKGVGLVEIITSYPIMRKGLSAREIEKENHNRRSFIDFLTGVLNLNPLERWTPEQARRHPFISGEPFHAPYVPPSCLPSTSPSRSLTILNGEVREIRGVRSRSSSNSNIQLSPPIPVYGAAAPGSSIGSGTMPQIPQGKPIGIFFLIKHLSLEVCLKSLSEPVTLMIFVYKRKVSDPILINLLLRQFVNLRTMT